MLNREFLEIRAGILALGAALDRIERASGDTADDPRMARIKQALARLGGERPGRAEQVQLIFSLDYDQAWRRSLGVDRG
jgi:hypothetical protein